jgi:hypothetical protein
MLTKKVPKVPQILNRIGTMVGVKIILKKVILER